MEKARYWVGVCYPENMIEDWASVIGEKLQLPYAYCVHNKDCTTAKEDRKDHVHIMLCFPNTTTKKTAVTLFNKLSLEGMICCPSAEQVHNVRFMYEYLIHNTEDCKKKGKYLYEPKERICGNNFDIGAFEQISTTDKLFMAQELADLIVEQNFENLIDLYMFVASNYEIQYFEVLKGSGSFFSSLCKGNYLKNHCSPNTHGREY